MQKLALRDLDKTLGAQLRTARQQKGLRQQDVANAIESPQSFVAKYEMGERILSTAEFLFLANLVELDWHIALETLQGGQKTNAD